MAVSFILRPQQDGQNPRRLQEKAKTSVLLQPLQYSRIKPLAKIPQFKKSVTSFFTNLGIL